MVKHLRAKLFHILHKPSPENPLARRINYVLAFLILSNALSVALETVPSVSESYGSTIALFEAVSRRCPDRSCRFESVVMNIMLPS